MADPVEDNEVIADELLFGQMMADNETLRGIEKEIQLEIAGFGLDPDAVFSVDTAISLAISAATAVFGPRWFLAVSAANLGGMVLSWFGLNTELSAGEIASNLEESREAKAEDGSEPAAAIPVGNVAQAEVAIRSEDGTLKNADDLAAAARNVATKAGVTEEEAQFEVQQAMSQNVGEMQYGQDDQYVVQADLA